MTNTISRIFKSQLQHCPICDSETSHDDSFCQECGAALAQMTDQRFASNIGRLNPKLNKSAMKWPLIAIAVVLFISVPIVLFGFESSYSGFSRQYTADQARTALKERKFDEAAMLLERLNLSHPLSPAHKELLNDIYFGRADQRAAMLNYAAAIADLNMISTDYVQIAEVARKRDEFSRLLKLQQVQNIAAAELRSSKSISRRKRSVRLAVNPSPSPSTSPIPDSPPRTINRNALGASEPLTSNFAGPANPVANVLSVSDSLSNSVKSGANPRFEITSVGGSVLPSSKRAQPKPSPAHDNDASAEPLQTTGNAPSAKPVQSKGDAPSATPHTSRAAAKSNESDMVRYNELLAGYFTQERKQSSAANEPPTFKEWIDQKRPTF